MIPHSDRSRRSLELHTVSEWSESLWARICPVYEASFPEHIRKPERIVRNMMTKMDAFLHEGTLDAATCSMALTGLSADSRLLIIDYLAVLPAFRGRGAGRETVRAIADWAVRTYGVQGLLIEAEADDSEIGRGRTRFWQSCGFEATEYVHSYIWVPEKYRAMLLDLQPESTPADRKLPRDGRRLFDDIEAFHKASFAR
ncbi:N-acetyltransferase [Saccharibacillus sp. O23]|uniref:GNAT family N-acetyltransferase n=1 Tax=Saccharibacillus sp. O23 TaxID=2009338 RepID=UPI0015C5B11A|nr:GNAT family N-acetyltransferase [Saccharibacillus sp. O23]